MAMKSAGRYWLAWGWAQTFIVASSAIRSVGRVGHRPESDTTRVARVARRAVPTGAG